MTQVERNQQTRGSSNVVFVATSAGSVLSAFVASACCVGPLVFAAPGLGGAGLLVSFEPYRPYFVVLTLMLLVTGFYFTYRMPHRVSRDATDGASCDCPAPRTNRLGRVMLWICAVLVFGLLAAPYMLALVVR